MNVQNDAIFCGRRLRFLNHVSSEEVGYSAPQTDTFGILFPKNYEEGKKYPLEVVFHSAGHSIFTALMCLLDEGNHDIYHVPEDRFGLFLDCIANSDNGDWWWGGTNVIGEGLDVRKGAVPSPVERRCIAEVKWVIENMPIDSDMVYAVGNSMGGSGSLGVCLCRGDIFAAIKANVPAGVRHAADRCCLDTEAPEGFELPDPPVVVDYSAQNDQWSTGHEVLYKNMREKRYALHGYWGLFGHENNNSKMAVHNDLIHALPVMSIKLSDPYPVFTNSTTDDKNPWEHGEGADESGQVNGFFRWKNICDTADSLEMELWLLNENEWETRVNLPEKSTADLLIRRVRNFALDAGESFNWTLTDCDGNTVTGISAADSEGYPVIDGITVKQCHQTLKLTK